MKMKRKKGVFIVSCCILGLIIMFLTGLLGYISYKPISREKISQFDCIAEFVWMKKDIFSSSNHFSISGKEVERKTYTQYLSQQELENVNISLKNEIITVSDKDISVEINKKTEQEIVIVKKTRTGLTIIGVVLGLLISVLLAGFMKLFLQTKNIL